MKHPLNNKDRHLQKIELNKCLFIYLEYVARAVGGCEVFPGNMFVHTSGQFSIKKIHLPSGFFGRWEKTGEPGRNPWGQHEN